ncbi:Leucine-rich repeat serine/threonine-protein kinase 1 [Branchiostoma belcheri]|nr:Leucine-rich repeat serine/threonine-protein kinase 1 [Branchiostoma belcheri]
MASREHSSHSVDNFVVVDDFFSEASGPGGYESAIVQLVTHLNEVQDSLNSLFKELSKDEAGTIIDLLSCSQNSPEYRIPEEEFAGAGRGDIAAIFTKYYCQNIEAIGDFLQQICREDLLTRLPMMQSFCPADSGFFKGTLKIKEVPLASFPEKQATITSFLGHVFSNGQILAQAFLYTVRPGEPMELDYLIERSAVQLPSDADQLKYLVKKPLTKFIQLQVSYISIEQIGVDISSVKGEVQLIYNELKIAILDGSPEKLKAAIQKHGYSAIRLVLGKDLEEGTMGSLLHIASREGHVKCVNELLEIGANVNALEQEGTPLSLACQFGHTDVTELLLEHEADPWTRIHRQGTALEIASRHGHMSVINIMLENYPDLVSSPSTLTVQLYAACCGGHLPVVQFWLANGARLTSSDEPTPLYGACSGGHVEVARFLLDCGVCVTQNEVDSFPEVLALTMEKYISAMDNRTTFPPGENPAQQLVAKWRQRHLYAMHETWLQHHTDTLAEIDLSHNALCSIPAILPWGMNKLERLNLSHNALGALSLPEGREESNDILCLRMVDMDVSHNRLQWVPPQLFLIPSLEKLNLSNNQLKSLEYALEDEITDLSNRPTPGSGSRWRCEKLKILDVSHNQLTELPEAIKNSKDLSRLILNHNKVKLLPNPWGCPLDILDASSNLLRTLPASLEFFWSDTLRYLILKNNKLDEIRWEVCRLKALTELNVSHNRLEKFPKPEHWKCPYLTSLDISHNKLTNGSLPESPSTPGPEEKKKKWKLFGKKKSTGEVERPKSAMFYNEDDHYSKEIEFPDIFIPRLQTLLMNDNNLQSVPSSICKLTRLEVLDLSNNPDLHELPLALGNLRQCWQLGLDGLSLHHVPSHVRPVGSSKSTPKVRDLLAFLRAQLRMSEPCNKVKLMLVGKEGTGKTTVLDVLMGRPAQQNMPTNGVQVGQWCCLPPRRRSAGLFNSLPRDAKLQAPEVIFNTWDMGGQEVYYPTHQCFLSQNTLFLVTYNLTLREKGISNLKPWLLNIQARAPNSYVIIVGTFLDCVPKNERAGQVAAMREMIRQKYLEPVKGFPDIRAIQEVSCSTGEGVEELRQAVYEVACNMKDKDTGEKLVGRKVPRSYLELMKAVEEEAQFRLETERLPVLNEEETEFSALVQNLPDNDITTKEDRELAVRFLHEIGSVVHFSDHLRGLDSLYFLDPSWLCDMLAKVLTVEEINRYVQNGRLHKNNVPFLFKDSRFPEQFIPKYLQLLERFEIAMAVDDQELLVPSQLPQGAPAATEYVSRKLLRRYYRMVYVPSGFWSRLISRLIIGLERINRQERKSQLQQKLASWKESRVIKRHPSKSFKLQLQRSYYWREAMEVVYQGGEVRVQSLASSAGMDPSGMDGVEIIVKSETNDFSVMGFIADQIDILIMEWFPGLKQEVDDEGRPLVQCVIPCPECLRRHPHRCSAVGDPKDPNRPHEFMLEECGLVALQEDTVECPKHPDTPVQLAELVPDLLLVDLPEKLVMQQEDLQVEFTGEHLLGVGGMGGVYRALYKGQEVAVKCFHSEEKIRRAAASASSRESRGSEDTESPISSASSAPSFDGQLLRTLQGTQAVKAFSELRREVIVLRKLHHPCVVSLLGVSRRPLCLAIELAPMGSLRSVLDAKQEERGNWTVEKNAGAPFGLLLERDITYKIALQVASALKYIHDREIVYCDLKSDNVLVWSLDPQVPINVKISDYGISQFSSPQGVLSSDGTPGFQAPEVRPGMVYDFKVDIFSYAMLLYELSTGLRPLGQYTSGLEIAQALREGVRPSLSDRNISINFPCLEMLMRKCWVADPQRRPTIRDVIEQLKDMTFISQQRVIELNRQLVSSMLPLQAQDGRDTVSVWGGEGGRRTYSVVDVEQEVFRIDQKKLPGANVYCMAGVGANIWAGTGTGEIEVYGHRRTVGLQDHLWTIRCSPGNQVLSLLGHQVEEVENLSSVKQRKKRKYQEVYVGLNNGTLRLYRRAVPDNMDHDDDNISRTESMVVAQEESEWEEVKEIVLGDNPEERVTCMALVNNNKELWVGCGGTIVIIGTATKLKEHSVELFYNSLIQLRCHENRVWCFERGSAKVLELDPCSHQQVREFSCEGDQVTVGSILVVKDTLWVGTSTGDVQVFNINPDSPHYDIGQLLATLKTEPPEQGCDYGSIQHMTAVGGNKVVYARDQIRNADSRMWYQMVTWGAMGTHDIHRVQSFWNELRQAEREILKE